MPVVCAVVESVTERGVDAGVTLRDPTGNLSGTLQVNYAPYGLQGGNVP